MLSFIDRLVSFALLTIDRAGRTKVFNQTYISARVSFLSEGWGALTDLLSSWRLFTRRHRLCCNR